MGGARSTYGEEDMRIQGYGGENLRERDHLEDQDVDMRVILRRIFRKWDGSGREQVTGICECGNELSGSIKCGEFLC
jgi:hypothetical protein